MRKIVAYTALGLIIGELALILMSWFLTATMTDGVRSLLSGEGIRFFFGSFTQMLLQPVLVWMLLLSMAVGCLRGSGMLKAFRREEFRRRLTALRLSAVLLLVMLAVVVALSYMPHAVLLSATGTFWPSPFSRALVPIVAFAIVVLAAFYGLMTRHFLSFADVCQAMAHGLAQWAPLFVLYVLAAQFIASFHYVFFTS